MASTFGARQALCSTLYFYEGLGPLAGKPFVLSSDNQALRKTLGDLIDEMARLRIARPPVLELRNFYRHP